MIQSIVSKLPLGRKHIEQAKHWIPSLFGFGAAAGAIGLYFTDWKVITGFIPFYRGKYDEKEE